jgi:hypothetical protein
MSVYRPVLLDDTTGTVVNDRSTDAIEAHLVGSDHAYATASLPPLGWNAGRPDGSRMIGWTLNSKGAGSKLIAEHAFSINPQSISRSDTPRNQMFATQGGFYVDAFGAGPVTISLTQYVAHGRASAAAGGGLVRATMREDVVRFYDKIYTAAVANPGTYDVFFYDSHLWDVVDSKVPERVYFPAQSWQLLRSVSAQNVWQVQLTMITLDATPPATTQTPQVPSQPKIRVHVVRRGETLKRIAAKLAGRDGTHRRVLQLEQQIVALTRKYGADDIAKGRDVPTYSTAGAWVSNVHVSRNHLAVGEKIILPAG